MEAALELNVSEILTQTEGGTLAARPAFKDASAAAAVVLSETKLMQLPGRPSGGKVEWSGGEDTVTGIPREAAAAMGGATGTEGGAGAAAA